jgi:hypothetical protein
VAAPPAVAAPTSRPPAPAPADPDPAVHEFGPEG